MGNSKSKDEVIVNENYGGLRLGSESANGSILSRNDGNTFTTTAITLSIVGIILYAIFKLNNYLKKYVHKRINNTINV